MLRMLLCQSITALAGTWSKATEWVPDDLKKTGAYEYMMWVKCASWPPEFSDQDLKAGRWHWLSQFGSRWFDSPTLGPSEFSSTLSIGTLDWAPAMASVDESLEAAYTGRGASARLCPQVTDIWGFPGCCISKPGWYPPPNYAAKMKSWMVEVSPESSLEASGKVSFAMFHLPFDQWNRPKKHSDQWNIRLLHQSVIVAHILTRFITKEIYRHI